MVLTIVILLLLCLIAYLLLMPMELCIDSYRNRYFLRLGFLAKASLEKDPLEILRLHLKVLFLHFYWRPSDLRALGKGGKTRKDKPKKRGRPKKNKK